ncbi:MAG: Na(+)-translocating NADH-quinone reductase subunit A [Bacteroidales bacterium]|nr:Na(+)-translocating NADH-quinone reductase subunit A [Lentimicrobiaceae bacterium]MDD5695703.1 Na(+)-translocating NADH-quinone reductase subunit A [Bacteroidales bacterium]
MPKTIKIRKGLDIKLLGEAASTITERISDFVAIKPTDFHGVIPRLSVQEGDRVKSGSILFHDKHHEQVLFASPVSGEVTQIKRGAKRVIREICIHRSQEEDYVDFGAADPSKLTTDEVRDKMIRSGSWPVIRQRPYSLIADPAGKPKSIFISCFDSAPLAPDYEFLLRDLRMECLTGLDVLARLTDGKIYLGARPGSKVAADFALNPKVEINYFSGPHPSGNIGVQIHHLDPINKGDVVWYVNVQDLAGIGRLFLTGRYDATRIIALTGSEIIHPQYCKVLRGSSVAEILNGNVKEGNVRYISGNALTGSRINRNGYLGFYDHQITVLPEGNYHEFLGWALPGLKKYSFSHTFFSWLYPGRKYRLDTNLHGANRAFVMTGQFEKVFPMDIYPVQLIKAILIKDIDLMENLGIYEVDEEDFALCEFIDTSKIEIQSIVREGLDLMRQEMS